MFVLFNVGVPLKLMEPVIGTAIAEAAIKAEHARPRADFKNVFILWINPSILNETGQV